MFAHAQQIISIFIITTKTNVQYKYLHLSIYILQKQEKRSAGIGAEVLFTFLLCVLFFVIYIVCMYGMHGSKQWNSSFAHDKPTPRQFECNSDSGLLKWIQLIFLKVLVSLGNDQFRF